MRLLRRNYHPIRLMTKVFDRSYIDKEERELLSNIRELRKFIKELIKERREETKDDHGDFLSILIQDELYKDNEDMMVDESLLFLIASSQTTATMVTECLFRMIQNKNVLIKVRNEVAA